MTRRRESTESATISDKPSAPPRVAACDPAPSFQMAPPPPPAAAEHAHLAHLHGAVWRRDQLSQTTGSCIATTQPGTAMKSSKSHFLTPQHGHCFEPSWKIGAPGW